MSVKKRFLSIVLSIVMLIGLTPGGAVLTASAAGGYDNDFSMKLSDSSGGANRYLTTENSNAFNVIMYNSTFSGVFGDQHMSGIELLLNGYRIATNGDIHYLPTPEQWDATPAPTRGAKTIDEATNTITVPMTFNGATDGSLRYNIVATPEPGGVLLSVVLTSDMPESLAGKARFNLEFIPSRYESKSFQVDSTGSGEYDTFGVFPLHPQSTMEEIERPNLPSQAWYVKEWNTDRGKSQPLPFAKGYEFSFAPEDELYNISISSDTGELELYDGRDRAQNGWYVLSGLIPEGKSGDVVTSWHIRPKVIQNWVREPNIAFSQAGYAPDQEKFAVMELDKYDNNFPATASLLQVNADGSKDAVYTADVTSPVSWQRYKYVKFDFTNITQTGMYVIQYGDKETEIFPIANNVYNKSWQSALTGFLAVQMDHIEVRDGNRVWHGASHMDDCSIGPLGISWFDGMSMPRTMPASIAERGFTPDEYIPGLNVGGWFDAGDFDLQGSREIEVLNDLIFAAEAFDNMDGHDTLSVQWDDKTGGVAEMHKPDGIPDIVQQVAHGIKYVLAQYDVLGGYGGTMELRRLRQYTHLGDPSSDTDGYIYDPALSEGQIVERDGLVYSGVPDDRVLLLSGGGGSFTSTLTGNTSASIAGAAYVLKEYYPELAEKCLNTALEIWDKERTGQPANLNTEWNTLVQLMLATNEFGNSRYDEFKTRLSPLVSSAFGITTDWWGNKVYGISSRCNALFIMDLMEEDYGTTVRNAVTEYANSINYTTPFGVQWTTGSGWGGSPNIVGFGQRLGIMYSFFPDIPALKTYTLRAADYILGRHPVTNNSWLSGVGTKSHLHPYNSNRADESFIPGSILPGHITVAPDIVESLDDFNFLWFENESIINYQSKWISVGFAASMIANETAATEQAPTKDFNNDFMMSIEKTDSIDGYLQTPGFELFMYNNTYDAALGDKKNAGIELIQSGRRIATNGDISLLDAPEQWDYMIAPVLNERTVDEDKNTLSASMTIPADSDDNPEINYTLNAEPEEGGVKLTMNLDRPLPKDLIGKAGFSLQFIPSQFISKSFQADADGDGNYDTFGVFPLVPQDDMVSAERARTEDQPWYVKSWYNDEGEQQPLPLATGKKMTFAAEDSENRIRITSDSGDLALYDGRNNTQDGWFILRTMIPSDETEIVWHISPDVKKNWERKPNVAFNQAGYAPDISKVALIELDPNSDAPEKAYVDRLSADGRYIEVFSAELGESTAWARYHYRQFDFSSVSEPGIYVIRYAGERSNLFPIADHVYDRTWQASLSGFLAVHMDHMKVREGYRIWHGQTFADDALQAPLGTQWFDGWSMDEETDSTYDSYEHIPGLAVGGWFDPSDNDLDTASNLEVIQDLALAFKELGLDYDTLMVDTDASFVELHRVDGSNDVQQQVKQGVLQILGQIENVGFVFKGMKVPTLMQYSQSGDASKATDGLVYDSSLDSDDTSGLQSGKLDDRLAFIGVKDVALQFDAAAALASASYVLEDFDDDLAARCLEAAEDIWNNETIVKDDKEAMEQITAEWNTAIQLLIATDGSKDEYKEFMNDVAALELKENFGADGWKAVRILKYMNPGFQNRFEKALEDYIPVLDNQISANPFGVPIEGGSAGVLDMGLSMSILHKHFPSIVSEKYTLSAVNYILGTHMYNNTSWLSGVGTKSAEHGYGSNRADRYFIAGGIVAGASEVLPEFPEAVDDYTFLRDQTGYSIDTAARWIAIGYAASQISNGTFTYDNVLTPDAGDLINSLIEEIIIKELPVETQFLDNALRMLSNGQYNQAKEQMEQFIHKIQDTNDKKLSEEQAEYLVNKAMGIISLIEDEKMQLIQPIEEAIAVLKETVAGLDITDEIKNALMEKLDQTLQLLEGDKPSEAVEALDGFIGQAEEVLTEEQAEELIRAAEVIQLDIVTSWSVQIEEEQTLPQTIEERISGLKETVAGLDIADEIKNALKEKLDQTLQLLEEDKTSEAVEALDGFIGQAEEVLTEEQAEELTKAAKEIQSDMVSSIPSPIEEEQEQPTQTIEERISGLKETVAGLDIADEIKNSLTEKLDWTLQLLEEDKSSGAVEALDGFIGQAEEVLTEEQAKDLIKAAKEIQSDMVSSIPSPVEEEQAQPTQTIVERISGLKESVASLDIADEIKNSLTEKLDQALQLLANTEEDKSSEAVEVLDSFILQAKIVLVEEQAEALIKTAEEIKSDMK